MVQRLWRVQKALSESMIVDNITQLNDTIESITKSNLEKKDNILDADILFKSCSNIKSMIIDNYSVVANIIDSAALNIKITTSHLYLFDKLVMHKNGENMHPFICILFKNLTFEKFNELYHEEKTSTIQIMGPKMVKRPENITKFILKINSGAIVDMLCTDFEWKYFVKFAQKEFIEANIIIHGDSYKINLNFSPITASIREEILLRLLAFISHSHHTPKKD